MLPKHTDLCTIRLLSSWLKSISKYLITWINFTSDNILGGNGKLTWNEIQFDFMVDKTYDT